ncbi:hypothetical protein [Sphingobium sp. CECT 9361]|uniref:hypothetical protein n=1 Tax=Sphingobium sp. CECT 9361 TaxID=2845384 RepID=UPI001E288619|nr:hypothetical protein [Sphingobium sp. CECT 9361]CAH0348360.1 hypothetical protein SPH9361_00061 [Sphingobium sp. CECT 9361]
MTRADVRLPSASHWRLLPAVAIVTLLLCSLMVGFGWHAIATFGFRDPDDALRYVEVRDFLNGQNWFDVSQHRINPPIGGPMHWSRLVDLPIAALILLFRPLFGAVMADRLAMAIVPLLLTGALCLTVGLAVRRLSDTVTAIAASALIALSIPIVIQFLPMRIDHHSWQILMAAVALWATFDTQLRRSGIVTGLAAAFWMHVSSEGLPYAVVFGGVFALAFLRDAATWDRLWTYAVTLAAASAVFLLGTRGWPEATRLYCDAISPVYLLPMIAAAIALPLLHRIIGTQNLSRRALISAIAACVGAAVYLSVGDVCRGGPFEALDPIVYKYWYLNVAEGRPVWEQTPLMIGIVILPPLVGMIGMLISIRRTQGDQRFAWLTMLLLSGGAYAVSLMVMRALSVSYLMALPGIATLIVLLLPKAQSLRTAPGRIMATVALCGITPLGLAAILALLVSDKDVTTQNAESSTSSSKAALGCTSKAHLVGLAALPRGTIMAPLDVGPNLLAFTPHSVVATSHHRNNVGIRDVLLTFMGRPSLAERIVMQHKVRYLVYCEVGDEIDNYVERAPHGFMADLKAGRIPDWLQRVPMPPSETIRVYRVVTPAAR